MTPGKLLALDRPLKRGVFALVAGVLLLLDAAVKAAMLGFAAPSVVAMVPGLINSSFIDMPAAKLSDGQLLLWLAFGLGTSWLTTVLALRRAADAGTRGFVAALAMIPVFRLPLIVYLSLLPSVPASSRSDVAPRPGAASTAAHASEWLDAAAAVFVGAGVAVATVAVGALIFGSYQYGMFVLAPFFIGIIAGYLLNRRADAGLTATTNFVWLTTLVGSLALLALALEGLICIIVIAPLGFVVAWLGGALGRGLALAAAWRRANAFGGLLLLPFVLGIDSAMERPLVFEVQTSIEIAAPPTAVWASLVQMSPIQEPPELVFRLGVAYPMGGELFGEGIGAVRHGLFSTGTAVERVSVWEPRHELAFEVLSEPPSMREMSFYEEVHAPHVHGYFSTVRGSFRLDSRPGGTTRLVDRTHHSMRLEPAAYWLPFARWIVRKTHERVLRHIKEEAERGRPQQGALPQPAPVLPPVRLAPSVLP